MEGSKVYVIHENDLWVEPLRAAFAERGVPYAEWFLDRGLTDLAEAPPDGVFYNRMSASSHTRGHRCAPEYTACVLAWLERHGRRVVNTGRALGLEISKVAQYAALDAHGICAPRTVAAVGRDRIVAAARAFDGPFITKHNRAGKGLGVHLFDGAAALSEYVDSPGFEDSVDGVTLIQEYIEAPEPFITRMEFVGGEFLLRRARGHLARLRSCARPRPAASRTPPIRPTAASRLDCSPSSRTSTAGSSSATPDSSRRTASRSPASSSSSTARAAPIPTTSIPTPTTIPRRKPRLERRGAAWGRSPTSCAASSPASRASRCPCATAA